MYLRLKQSIAFPFSLVRSGAEAVDGPIDGGGWDFDVDRGSENTGTVKRRSSSSDSSPSSSSSDMSSDVSIWKFLEFDDHVV